MQTPLNLSRRERQIMDVVYARGEATASQVLAGLPDPPTRTAVRTLLGIMERKGHLRHARQGREFVYRPTRPRQAAGRSALRSVLGTFFDGSLEKAVAAHLLDRKSPLPDHELHCLAELIRKARDKGE